jgi:hypothetical protein
VRIDRHIVPGENEKRMSVPEGTVGLVPEGLDDRSPTPQGLRRDRNTGSSKSIAVGCAVVCEGDQVQSAWKP